MLPRCLPRFAQVTAVEHERKSMARKFVADVRRLDRDLAINRKRCAEAVAASGRTLPKILGLGDVPTAKILGHIGDITRFATAGHYASYTGTAPIEASTGTSAVTGCVVPESLVE